MDTQEYTELAKVTLNSTPPVLRGDKSTLVNVVLGLTGEVGEFANLIKKFLFHNHPVTLEQFSDELGDVLWYFVMVMDLLGLDFVSIMEMNIAKLKERYPQGFSTEASINRKR